MCQISVSDLVTMCNNLSSSFPGFTRPYPFPWQQSQQRQQQSQRPNQSWSTKEKTNWMSCSQSPRLIKVQHAACWGGGGWVVVGWGSQRQREEGSGTIFRAVLPGWAGKWGRGLAREQEYRGKSSLSRVPTLNPTYSVTKSPSFFISPPSGN